MELKKQLRTKLVNRNRFLNFLYNTVYLKRVLKKRCKITINDYGKENATDIPVIYSNNLVITFRGNQR